MALIKCYNCGADVSSLATQCPKCGANLQRHEVPISSSEAQPTSSKETHNKETNTWKILFIVLIVIVVLTSLIVIVLRDFETEDKVYSSSTPVSYNNNLSQLSEQMLGAYIDESNGFRRLTNPITLNTLVVTPSITHGIDGSIYYTGIQIRSLSDPMLQIDYAHFFSAGELQINGNIYIVGEVMDNKIIYDLSPYGSDLYIWGYQYNYDLSGTYIR